MNREKKKPERERDNETNKQERKKNEALLTISSFFLLSEINIKVYKVVGVVVGGVV